MCRSMISAILLATTLVAGCSGMGMSNATPEQMAARNLCEAMRSFEPYRWNQCGEYSPRVPG